MRAGDPHVWRELIAAWDAQFGLAPGELSSNVDERRYGPLIHSTPKWPELPLDCAISGESQILTPGEENWLKE